MLLGAWEIVGECISTLPSEFPLWKLESRWIFKFVDSDYKGQNPLIKEFIISLESFWNINV
jgi:hypothetical protein